MTTEEMKLKASEDSKGFHMELVGKNVICCTDKTHDDKKSFTFEVNSKHVSKSIAEQFLDGTFN